MKGREPSFTSKTTISSSSRSRPRQSVGRAAFSKRSRAKNPSGNGGLNTRKKKRLWKKRAMPGYVLDSFALIAYFRDETGAEKVEALLHKEANEREPLHMTEVNYAEVQYIVIRRNGLPGWEAVAERLIALPINFHPVTRDLVNVAAPLKAAHPISLADAFAAALAKTRNAELVTGDREFKVVEKELKKIHWLK